eukprot:COSAG06_NODE_8435_length_2175_cov_1.436416_1_plen_536_part_00
MVMLDVDSPRTDADAAEGPEAALANFIPGEVDEEPGANRGVGEEDEAAKRIQAMQRGKQARRDFQAKRPADTVDDHAPRANSALGGRAVVPVDDSRMVASDGMVPTKPKASKPVWDTKQIEELSLSKTELVKRNAELAAERRREELLAKQAAKQKLFKQMQRERKATIAAKRQAKQQVRESKAKKVADFEVQQERWKDYMYQKIQSEATRKQELDSLKVATLKERQERHHVEKESKPKPKSSYLDPHLREAGAVPGPGAYGLKEQNSGQAPSIGAVKAKSALDWQIYRASKLPGPAEYSPMNSKLYQSGGSVKFSADNSKSALDWEIYRAKQLPGPAAYSIGDQARDGAKNATSAPRFGADESKSMIDWVIHRARQLPGPQDYPEPKDSRNVGVRFSNGRPKTYLEWTIYRAKQLPGPGEYGAPMIKKQTGAKFTEGNPKSALDWEIYRGKQLPGPAAYFPTASHKQKLQMEKDARISAKTRADEVQSQTLEKAKTRELARLEARSSSQTAVDVGGPNDAAAGGGGGDLGNFVPS